MAWYCFWVPKKEGETWRLVLSSERPKLAPDKAEFITALDVDYDFSDENYPQEKVKYQGDFYLDFDSEDINETIGKVKEFLAHLRDEKEVDLDQLRYYASGKKGFHIEIPVACFNAKPSPSGYAFLPAIYKEMALSMYHDTMDMVVYSAKKGRLWRVPNHLRFGGKTYKVQLTAQEVLDMTADFYAKVVMVPRPALPVAAPTLNGALGTLWASGKDKVERRMKSMGERKGEQDLSKRFNKTVPESIERLMAGEGIKAGTGFQNIATQLAIIANGYTWECDDFIARCKGLIENHVGDSSRYRTAGQRRAELKRMYGYMHDNPTYVFSPGAVRSLVEGHAPDLSPETPLGVAEDGTSYLGVTLGMDFNKGGIYKLTDEGHRSLVSPVGITNVSYLVDLKTRESMGYDADFYIHGEFKARSRITMNHLSSKSRFQGMISSVTGQSCQVTDPQVNGLVSIFYKKAEQEGGGVVYVVSHEGLDIVHLPTGERDIIWVEERGVLSKLGKSYMYSGGVYGGTDHPYKTDLLSAPSIPPLSGKREGVDYLEDDQVKVLKDDLHHLLRMNSNENLAKVIGWGIACFLCPALRLTHDQQFPVLHLYGTAGAGKSTTVRAMTRFHGHTSPPELVIAGSSTVAPMLVKAVSTSSLPFVIDEYKPSELATHHLDAITMMLRSVFDAGSAQRGRVVRDNGDSQVVTPSFKQTAPVAFISEQREGDSAILQRSIVVPLNPQDNLKHASHAEALASGGGGRLFGSIGRLLVEYLIFSDAVSPEVIRGRVGEYEKQLEATINGPASDRPRYGIAVALTGLRFFKAGLSLVFGDEFNARLDELTESLLVPAEGSRSHVVTRIRPAIITVLDQISQMSENVGAAEDRRLIPYRDYAVTDDYVEISAKYCFQKYSYLVRAAGDRRLFSSGEAFCAALDQYVGATLVLDPAPGMRNVYRLDYRQLEQDGVERFRVPQKNET